MARTTKLDVIIPEIFTDAVQGALAQKDVLLGKSSLASLGIVAVRDNFGGDENDIGDEVTVPYFGTIGEFQENITDGDAANIVKIAQTQEKAYVVRDSLAFEATRWSRGSVGKDAYDEGVDQITTAVARQMDKRVLTAAAAPGGLRLSKYNASAPNFLNYDLMVEGKMLWGDEQEDVVGMAVHSYTLADLYKLRDGNGRPLLTTPEAGGLPRFLGVPIVVSDKCPIVGSGMGAVTSTGTAPPAIAITGNAPLGAWKLRIKVITAGARGTATIAFSVDDGQNYSAPILTAASMDLVDPTIDSLIGVNGKTGLTISYANAAAAADNVWTASASVKATSLVFKKNALAFWYNRAALALQTDKDITRDSSVAAMHLYSAPIRYRRRPGGTKPGVVAIEHNVGIAA